MTALKKNLPYIIHGVVVVSLLGGIVFLHMKVRTLWLDVATRQTVLQSIPDETAQTATMKKDLDQAQETMREVNTTIPTEDGLVDVIAAISQAAVAAQISAQLPVVGTKLVTEDEKSDDTFSDVRIHILASGNPAALASFLYKVEHLPYLLRVVFLKVDTIQQSSIASYAESIPQEIFNGKRVLQSSLEAEVAIVTRKKDILSASPTPTPTPITTEPL
jgi:Tfp pilus assembly protein PilO